MISEDFKRAMEMALQASAVGNRAFGEMIDLGAHNAASANAFGKITESFGIVVSALDTMVVEARKWEGHSLESNLSASEENHEFLTAGKHQNSKA